MTRLDAVFEVSYGNKLDMNKMIPAGRRDGITFVGRRGGNQGVSGYVQIVPDLEPYAPGIVTVALGGSYLLSAFVQQRPFYTAQNVADFKPPRPRDVPSGPPLLRHVHSAQSFSLHGVWTRGKSHPGVA